MNSKIATIITLIALLSIFLAQNTEVVQLRLFIWELAMSRALMFIFLVIIGIVLGWFIRGHKTHTEE